MFAIMPMLLPMSTTSTSMSMMLQHILVTLMMRVPIPLRFPQILVILHLVLRIRCRLSLPHLRSPGLQIIINQLLLVHPVDIHIPHRVPLLLHLLCPGSGSPSGLYPLHVPLVHNSDDSLPLEPEDVEEHGLVLDVDEDVLLFGHPGVEDMHHHVGSGAVDGFGEGLAAAHAQRRPEVLHVEVLEGEHGGGLVEFPEAVERGEEVEVVGVEPFEGRFVELGAGEVDGSVELLGLFQGVLDLEARGERGEVVREV